MASLIGLMVFNQSSCAYSARTADCRSLTCAAEGSFVIELISVGAAIPDAFSKAKAS